MPHHRSDASNGGTTKSDKTFSVHVWEQPEAEREHEAEDFCLKSNYIA